MIDKNMTKYVLEMGWQMQARDLNISVHDVLRYAQLPEDLLTQSPVLLTKDEYMRLWHGFEFAMRDDPLFPLKIGKSISVEGFNPTLFACICSKNLEIALDRIKKYKQLVAPMRFELEKTKDTITFAVRDVDGGNDLPPTLFAGELVFWVQLARIATREEIVPHAVHYMGHLPCKEEYEAYFGTKIIPSEFNGVSFTLADARRPFLTSQPSMWKIFEPELNRRLQDLNQEATFTQRVRASLMEMLASGQYSMKDVANKLAVSTRTLQRRLAAEDTTFQKELECLREELAHHYLNRSDYTNNQIAFLLGYEEPTSFYRAFRTWTGHTPESMRANINSHQISA